MVRTAPGAALGQVGDQRLGGRLASQAEQGHQDEQGREDRQDPVVGQGGRPVRQEVPLEFTEGAFTRSQPGAAAAFRRVAFSSEAPGWAGGRRRSVVWFVRQSYR